MRTSSSPSTAPSIAADRERVLERHPAREHEAAEHVGREPAALLVGEERDRERPLELDARGDHRLDHLEAGEHAERAVEAAAGRDGVDVAPGQHRRVGALGRPRADDVADLVDVDAQAEVAHPADDEIATAAIVVGEREPRATAAVDRADLGERVEAGAQARERDRRRPSRSASPSLPSPQPYTMSRGSRAGTRAQAAPVAARIAATTAGVDEIVGGSPTPFAPNGRAGLGLLDQHRLDRRRVERGRDQVVGEARVADPALVDDQLLHHREPDALGDAAFDLARSPATG